MSELWNNHKHVNWGTTLAIQGIFRLRREMWLQTGGPRMRCCVSPACLCLCKGCALQEGNNLPRQEGFIATSTGSWHHSGDRPLDSPIHLAISELITQYWSGDVAGCDMGALLGTPTGERGPKKKNWHRWAHLPRPACSPGLFHCATKPFYSLPSTTTWHFWPISCSTELRHNFEKQ